MSRKESASNFHRVPDDRERPTDPRVPKYVKELIKISRCKLSFSEALPFVTKLVGSMDEVKKDAALSKSR